MHVPHVLATALVIQTIAGNAHSALYQALPLQNVIFTNNLLFESRAWTKGQCALLCQNNAGCVTFTFTENSTASSGTCRGHSILQFGWDPQTAKANTFYLSAADIAIQHKAGNCQDVRTLQPTSGVRQLWVTGISLPVSAYCDQTTDGGNWTVIQRRQDGSVNFNCTLAEYRTGFGDPEMEFWLGLETMYWMTTSQRYEIRFDLQMYDGTQGFAVYSNFSVGPSSDFYRLDLGTMTAGNLSDNFCHHKGMRFSTWNSDNDQNPSFHCAAYFGGGWWFRSCADVALNNNYTKTSTCLGDAYRCPFWSAFGPTAENSLAKTAMKVRPMLE